MIPDPPAVDTVTFRYMLGRDDLLDGVTRQYQVARKPGYLRWLPPLLITLLGLVVLAVQVLAGQQDTVYVVAFLVALAVAVGVGVISARSGYVPRFGYRISVAQIMRGNPQLADPIEAILSDSGIRTRASAAESSYNWKQYPFYTETARSFALLASDRVGGLLLVLPKRGLTGADEEQLRAMLARHSRRLG